MLPCRVCKFLGIEQARQRGSGLPGISEYAPLCEKGVHGVAAVAGFYKMTRGS